jgi:hypothetical protein
VDEEATREATYKEGHDRVLATAEAEMDEEGEAEAPALEALIEGVSTAAEKSSSETASALVEPVVSVLPSLVESARASRHAPWDSKAARCATLVTRRVVCVPHVCMRVQLVGLCSGACG